MIALLPDRGAIRVASAEVQGGALVLLAADWGRLVEIRVSDAPPVGDVIDLRRRTFVMEQIG